MLTKEEEAYCNWSKKYWDDDLGVFMQNIGLAVLTVAQWEDRRVNPSYRIVDLNRVKVRRNFEERLYDVTRPNSDYTERDKELIAEYFRINTLLRKDSN